MQKNAKQQALPAAWTQLERDNLQLKRTVRSLLARIEDNQRIDRHFKRFEFKLLNCNRLGGFLELLLEESQNYFELADVGLILVDRDYAIRRLLQVQQLGDYDNRLQLRSSVDFALSLFSSPYRVVLGPLESLCCSRLFPNRKEVGSAAVLPLLRNGNLIGSLHFASADGDRFSADKAADFMCHLASIVAVCLDNCLAHEHLFHQSCIDMLTGVNNRRNFEQEYARELERSERSDEPLSCLFVDMDQFKKINDSFGHQAGDRCLQEVASAIATQLRKTDILARYGGEEFVAVLHRCENTEGQQIAERIRAVVESLSVRAIDCESRISPTVSIGLACWKPIGERSPDLARLGQLLLRRADEALYAAKQGGRNRVVCKPFSQ